MMNHLAISTHDIVAIVAIVAIAMKQVIAEVVTALMGQRVTLTIWYGPMTSKAILITL